jgi:PAS domain S-box-containing protein
MKTSVNKSPDNSDGRLLHALASAGIGTFSYEFETAKTYYSREHLSLYGLSEGSTLELDKDLVAKNLFPPDKPRFLEEMKKANDPCGSGILDLEFRIIHADGKIRWLRSRGVTVFSGNKPEDRPLYANGIVQDITDRKNAESALIESEARFRSIFENSLIGISTASSEGKLLQVNRAYAKMYGFDSPEQMLSVLTSVETLYAYAKQREEVLRILKTDGFMEAREIEVIRRDGTHFFVLVSAVQIKDADGKLLYNQATHIDLTEREKNEMEIKKSKELLEKLNQHLHDVWENEKAQIALNIHDDLGQKLTALSMDLAWIKSRMGVQSQAVIQKLKEVNHDIFETIEEIKEISAFLRPSILFDIGIIPAIISLLEKFQQKSGITCQFVHQSEEFEIDYRLSLILYRIVQESFTNIARHSNAKNVKVNLKKIRNNIELQIIDNGIGISKEKINSFSSMGLAGIRERVKLVNGIVKIKGEKNIGTKIRVVIPFNSIKR